MKYFLAALLLATSAFADTPAQISADFKKQATAALAKVNDTLEKATVPLIAALLKAGDTQGANALREQLAAKTTGDAVMKPQPSAAALFMSYDAARVKALEPAQNAAVARIDFMLASSEGKKLEVVTELTQVREEIAAGKAKSPPTMPVQWSFRRTPTAGTDGVCTLNPDGTAEMKGGGGNSGQWKPLKQAGTFSVEWVNPKDTWTAIYNGKDLCEVHSLVWKDTRYIVAMPAPGTP
jgi:hypothetical protein